MITHDMQLMLDYSDRAGCNSGRSGFGTNRLAQVLTDKDLIAAANSEGNLHFTLAKGWELTL